MRTLRPGLAVVFAAAAVFSLAGGAGSGSSATTEPCPPTSGRQFCVTVTDTEPVSASVDGVVAYVLYTIDVTNVGGTALTNGVVSTTLTDLVGTTTRKSSAQFVAGASSPGCAAVSGPANTVACDIGNLAAGQSLTPSLQLVYRTSTTTGVVSTDATVVGAFKEKTNDKQGTDPNPDTFPVVETTTYEPCPDCSYAFAPLDQPVRLATTPDGDTWGSFAFTNRGGGVLARLDELNAASSADYCVSDRTCFGQVVHTQASTVTLGAGEVFAWETTWSLGVVSPGISDRNVVIVHTLDDNTMEVISRRCSAEPPTADDVAGAGCLVPSIDRRARTLTVRWYTRHNGFGRGG